MGRLTCRNSREREREVGGGGRWGEGGEKGGSGERDGEWGLLLCNSVN